LLIYHQVIFKSSKNEKFSLNFDLKSEFDRLFVFFSSLGKIIDFNLEHFPNLICITYMDCDSVNQIIKMKEINYISSTKEKIQLEASYIQPSIRIRNLKDSNLSPYDNFCYEEVNFSISKEEKNEDKPKSSFLNHEIKHEEYQNYNKNNKRYSNDNYIFCYPSQINKETFRNSWNSHAWNHHKHFKIQNHNIRSQFPLQDHNNYFRMNKNLGYSYNYQN